MKWVNQSLRKGARVPAAILTMACWLSGVPVWAAPSSGERPLMRFPTASATSVAFVAKGDLWTVPRAGGKPTQLTDDQGQVLAPHFSPDGRSIAFTWRKAGLNDVYVMPATGGTPSRLTHGPSYSAYDNLVTGWSPDGTNVLFVSRRGSPLGRYDVHAVPRTGGLAVALGLGHAGLASMSADGTKVAFDWSYRNLGGDRWKRYRGGQAGELFLRDRSTHTSRRLTHWEGIDTSPMWAGDRLFFLSDRGSEGRLNIWVLDPSTGAARQVTHYRDFDIDFPSIGPGGIAFSHGGRLHLLNAATGATQKLDVRLPIDVEVTPDLPAAPFVTRTDIAGRADYAMGTDGTAYLAARGDLFALHSDGGWTNLTRTPGRMDDHPAISPDGRQLAYITDEPGEQQAAILSLGRLSSRRILTHFASGMLYAPLWSPDGQRLAVADANKRLWLVDVRSGKVEQIASDLFAEIHDATFSADGRLLAYSITRSNQTRAIHVLDLTSGRNVEMTGSGESDHDPAFTSDNREIVFVSARREQPFVSDRDREGTIASIGSDGVYRATLTPEFDAATFQSSTRLLGAAGTGGFSQLSMHGRKLFYLSTPFAGLRDDLPGQASALRAFDLDTGVDRVVANGATSASLTPDRQQALAVRGDVFEVVTFDPAGPGKRSLSLDALRVTVDPKAERQEIFEQAWRLDRDLYWDRAMGGLDWRAMHDRYAPLAARARSHEDLIYVLGELQGELSTSHMFLGGGDTGDRRPVLANALIGADFAPDPASGRYLLTSIYRGDNSRERFRAPLGDPALDVRDGDILLAVNGVELRMPDDPYRLILDQHGPLRLTVAHASGQPGHTIIVQPISNDTKIRKLAWIEQNRRLIDRLSGGRAGYIYLSDFAAEGSEDFLRQYYWQSNKAALVIDDRDNGGGFTSQWVLDLLRRPQAGIFRNREGAITTLPGAVAPARLATITSIFSASDGDQFPYYFRAWNMGKVIGQRTWGGVRGIKGRLRLLDGTYITVPKDSLLTVDGKPLIENHGAEPDIMLDDMPSEVGIGKDNLLEQAVKIVLSNGDIK